MARCVNSPDSNPKIREIDIARSIGNWHSTYGRSIELALDINAGSLQGQFFKLIRARRNCRFHRKTLLSAVADAKGEKIIDVSSPLKGEEIRGI
jgi:hypothetical protein